MKDQLLELFNSVNKTFLRLESENIRNGVSERNLCGRFAIYLQNAVSSTEFSNYFVDIEYNRNYGGSVKTIINGDEKVTSITCDLILHSRGSSLSQDNLIAVEMKKTGRPYHETVSDRDRLTALTKSSFDGVWSNDGKTLPKHVCGYVWGIFIEIDHNRGLQMLTYFFNGEPVIEKTLPF